MGPLWSTIHYLSRLDRIVPKIIAPHESPQGNRIEEDNSCQQIEELACNTISRVGMHNSNLNRNNLLVRVFLSSVRQIYPPYMIITAELSNPANQDLASNFGRMFNN